MGPEQFQIKPFSQTVIGTYKKKFKKICIALLNFIFFLLFLIIRWFFTFVVFCRYTLYTYENNFVVKCLILMIISFVVPKSIVACFFFLLSCCFVNYNHHVHSDRLLSFMYVFLVIEL